MPRVFPRTAFPGWGIRRLLALGAALGAVGCHSFPQLYGGRRAVETPPAEERDALHRRPDRPHRSDVEVSGEPAPARPAGVPGSIKPVGYTQKNFGDAEPDDSVSPALGRVEWADSDTPLPSGGETAEPALLPILPRNLETVPAAGSAAVSAGPLPESERDQFIDELADFEPAPLAPAVSEPVKTALANSIEHPRPQNAAGMTFLPDLRNGKTPPSEPPEARDWREPTQEAIALLQKEIDRRVKNGELCAAEQARLRLLLLTTGNIPGAAEKIAGMDPDLQLFWERECRGLGRLIETEEKGAGRERLAARGETLPDFEEGVAALRSRLPLAVRKSLFVKEPSAFGYYKEVPPAFEPGQTVNAYFELDNVVCAASPENSGCDIAVLCRRELLDSLNRKVVEPKEKLCACHSASRLNDIVLNLAVRLPEEIPPGTYTLKTVFLDKHRAGSEPVTRTMKLRVD